MRPSIASNIVSSAGALVSSSAQRAIFYYNDVYRVVLPEKHRFPMEKYERVRTGLMKQFSGDSSVSFRVSPLATVDELAATHSKVYIENFISGTLSDLENRRIGFPWNRAAVERALSSVGGTVAATRAVCNDECLVSGHIAGGTHHAFYDRGEGFCVFSDIAVAANIALREHSERIRQILIVDLDVHQGNGNAVLFQDDSKVFTFSMHCKENYFSVKQKSDVDVEVDEGTGDDIYLSMLEPQLEEIFHSVKPQLVFYQAGVDCSRNDRLGKLKLSREGLQRRNQVVYDYVKLSGAKLVVTMGGGYPKDLDQKSEAFQDIVNAHMDVYEQCYAYTL